MKSKTIYPRYFILILEKAPWLCNCDFLFYKVDSKREVSGKFSDGKWSNFDNISEQILLRSEFFREVSIEELALII